ncbi:uncharacterized protein L3040_005766 [Drepanopeziza brunnea f. sp. 'multigermtubi']|uniref:uncharacterized protein n=1 Tax=Drepanopeziza brunnea f. sp. 'multigermtubi' TaxID=698441 RepID=UPI00238BB2C4|nr:hypothetical protein L3040_005766 [Drepanopeziza brunnea f. sp. 'multigermtubi']
MSNSETYSETGATQGSSPYQSLLFDEEGGSSGSSHPCTNTPENPGQSPSEDNSPPAEPDELVQQIRETIHAKLATVTHEQWYIGVERVTLAEMADELERKLPVEGHPWTVNLLPEDGPLPLAAARGQTLDGDPARLPRGGTASDEVDPLRA